MNLHTFDSLYEQYEVMVRAIALRALHGEEEAAADITQTVWMRAWEACQEGKTINKAWLQVVTQNAVQDLRRARQVRGKMESIEELAQVEDDDAGALDRAMFRLVDQGARRDGVLKEMLAIEVDSLPARTREIMTMHYYAAKSTPEIARELGISQNTVLWHLKSGRDTLRSRLIPSEEVA